MSAYDLFKDENGVHDFNRYSKIYEDAAKGILTEDAFVLLKDIYGEYETPPCRVCGDELSVSSMGGVRLTEYACDMWLEVPDESEMEKKPGRSVADDHWSDSRWTAPNKPDSLVIALIQNYEELQ